MRIHLTLFAFLLLVPGALRSAESIPVLVDTVFRGTDREGVGEFALEIAQADLSADPSLRLVDRRALESILKEQGLAASGLADQGNALKVGKLLSAKYMVGTKGLVAGDNMMVVVRVVQVETTLFRNKTIKVSREAAVEDVARDLTVLIKQAIGELGEEVVGEEPAAPEKVKIKKGAKRPRIALYIPEATDGQARAVDPACEHRLLAGFKEHGFEVVQLEHSSHAIALGEDGRPQGEEFETLLAAARKREVEVLIMGEAFSQRAGMLGQLTSSRARVEMHAIKVSDQSVVTSTSRYGTAIDSAAAISGKKAIEDATDRAFAPFVNKMMEGNKFQGPTD